MKERIKEICKKEFEKKFGPVYDPSNQVQFYLENGVTLWITDWNGERYMVDGHEYVPCDDGTFKVD